jgi:putative SOS response-associated peptidase YedK
MCGRFTLRANADALTDLFGVILEADRPPRFNIAPTQPVLAVRDQGSGREYARLRWGLVPAWTKEISGPPLINARAETFANKPAFRTAFRQRRCLVAADSFYEWHKAAGKKQPFSFRLRDGKPFALAGLWEQWTGGAEPVESCTIITTTANDLVRPCHDRMPVILARADYAEWLDPAVRDVYRLLELLQPYPAGEMAAVAVSPHVNNARHDDPRCLEPAAEA